MAVVSLTLFLLGIMLIIIYFAVMRKHTRCSAQVQGTLIKIGENTSRDVTRYEYYYSYRVDGIEYQLKTFDNSPEAKSVGDRCTIWYNPKKPKDSLAHRYKSYKAFKILLFGGIAMILLTFILPFAVFAISSRT